MSTDMSGAPPASTELLRAMEHVARQVEATLAAMLPAATGLEAALTEAMRYATLGAGKRLRPFLVLASADLFDVAAENALRVAAAVELVHSYSLVHDDLPCMDNGEIRRGRPTVHRHYDEATAVLAGDALLTLAFEVLAAPATHPDAEVRVDLIRSLAGAAGPAGMVGGQAMDLAAGGSPIEIGAITRLQHLKTGALITFCCEAAAILGRADPGRRQALKAYAHDLGLAFQIADDLLDVESSSAETGKSTGRDVVAGKATLVALMGAERARAQAGLLIEQACRHLDVFGQRGGFLADLARFVINRRA